jgi:hypothetical protein
LFAVLASGWLTVFGHNFYWIIGFWFLPVVAVCWSYFLMFSRGAHRPVFGIVGTLLFGLFIYLKCLTGYEYLSTICIAACVPVVYYSVLRGDSVFRLSGRLAFAGVLAVAGFVLAAQSHLNQIALYHPGDALGVLSGLVFKSTLPVGSLEAVPAGYHEALSFNPVLLLAMYVFLPLNQNAFFIPAILPLLIGGVLAFRILFRKDGNEVDPKARALAIATLFSIAAPLSWFILAKAHSARHFHYSFVLWYLPTIFWLVSLVASRFSLFLGKKATDIESVPAELGKH